MHQNCIITYPKVSCYSLYCRKCWTSGIVHWRRVHAVCHHWVILVSFQFPIFLFQMTNLVTVKKVRVCLLYLVDFFDPPSLLNVILFATSWGYVVDACHERTGICRCRRCLQPFSVVHNFSSRLFVVRLLSSNDSQTFLNSWYSGPTVAGSAHAAIQSVCHWNLVDAALYICPRMTSQLQQHSTMSISGSRWSMKNSVINRLSRWILLFSYTLTNLSHMTLASLYINTKFTTGWLSALTIYTAFRSLSPSHTNIFSSPSDAFSVFVIMGHFRDPLIIDITLFFLVHVHFPLALGPIGCTTNLSDFYSRIVSHIFFR